MLLFAAFQACGVVTALLATTSSAISAHPDCGTYSADSKDLEEIRNITVPYHFADSPPVRAMLAIAIMSKELPMDAHSS